MRNLRPCGRAITGAPRVNGWRAVTALMMTVLSVAACVVAPIGEASPSPTSSPAATAATTASPVPTPAPTAAPSPTGVVTPPPASPTPTVWPTPTDADTGGWVGPERISTRNYGELSLVVDLQGIAHAAAQLRGSIYYLTNESGSWTREQLSAPAGRGMVDGEPSIARDSDGSLWIAFARGECAEMFCFPGQIHLTTNASGTWSAPEPIADGDSPSLVVRDGHVHLAYAARQYVSDVACSSRVPIRYATNASGSWTDERVARHGESPTLQIGSDGMARILFGDYLCEFLGSEGVWYATATTATGSFTLEAIRGTTSRSNRVVGLALDAADQPHALFWRFDEDEEEFETTYYALRDDRGWTEPRLALDLATGRALTVDRSGAVHILGLADDGAWYATNAGGQFDAELILGAHTWWGGGAALAIDSADRPHFLFVIGEDEGPSELWYAVGPRP
jgi:hypothetical protein